MRSFTTKNIFTLMLLTAMLVVGGSDVVKGQSCVPQVRNYATSQQVNAGLLTSVVNPDSAINGNPKSYSTISRLLGVGNLITVTQYLKFSSQITAGTPVTIKATFPSSILSLLAGVEIQPFTNLHNDLSTLFTWSADAAGVATSGSNLLGLLNGAGDFEVTITPKNSAGTPVNYDGVWIRLAGVAIGQSLNVFHAYTYKNASNIDCNTPIDILSGVRAGAIALANATGTVSNPWAAIDNDPTLSTYAEMNVGVQVLSDVFHTTIFKTQSQPGDAVQMIIQDPGGGLLDLSLLNGFNIRLYNGSIPVGTAFTANSGLLSLKLLPGPTNKKYKLIIPSDILSGSFDRVEVSMGGLADVGLVPGLRIYDVKRIINPITQIGGSTTTKKEICLNTTAALSIKDPQDCTNYVWYKKGAPDIRLTPGTSTTSYTPTSASLSVGDNIFYVVASRTNCTETSENMMDTIKVNPLPTATIAGTATVCKDTPAPTITLTGSSGTAPYTFTYTINGSTQTITTTAGNSVTLSQPTGTPGTFTYTLTSVSTSQCNQSITGQSAVITVSPIPSITLGTLPSACQEAQTTTIPYTSTTGTPITYNIIWDANALAKGFTNVSAGTFPTTSPITITKPTSINVIPGLYGGTITVSNANCTSQSYPISFTVLPRPPTPNLNLMTNP